MLLAIETSSLVSSVALLHEQTLRAELTIQARLTHSEQLMPHIADMLDKASVGKADIDGIVVSIGPGSFTGLRIGLATAKGLAFAWQTPIVGIETPTSLAWNFVGNADKICPLIDAQKGNVYASVYKWNRGILETLDDVSVMPLDDVLERLQQQGEPSYFAETAPCWAGKRSPLPAIYSALHRRRWLFLVLAAWPLPASSAWPPERQTTV